ncbi:MAG: tetratricopeptide repeat protein [Ferruginibacter sp.]
MLFKKLFFSALLFIGVAANAQKIKSQATFRTLKTASSLLEAQQFEAAEEYFRKGLQSAKQFQDLYCQAVACEGLGNYFSKTEQTDSATAYYKKAITLYKAQNLNMSALITESLLKSVQGIGDLYAGIEVGAKGIKLSVIEVKLNKERQFDYTLKADTSINTDAASLSYQSEKESRDAITILMDIAVNRFNIVPKRTYIVVSSGLKQELDKYEKVDYFTQVIRPKNLDTAIHISYINPEQESELSFTGIVPQKNKFANNQLDVGSGNTKGGFFSKERKFIPVNFSLGTKSFQRLIEGKTGSGADAFVKTADQLFRDSLNKVIIDELVSKADFKSRDVIYLSGGIVWCMATLLHPQSAAINNYTEISSADISEFRRRVAMDYSSLVKPDLSFIKSYEDLVTTEKNLNRAINTYDQKAMQAGSIWLDELVKQINTINPGKKFIYPKYAYVGWISGYIMKKVNQQFTSGAR